MLFLEFSILQTLLRVEKCSGNGSYQEELRVQMDRFDLDGYSGFLVSLGGR